MRYLAVSFFTLAILACFAFYYRKMQDNIIFRSVPLSKDHSFNWTMPHEEFFIPVSDGGEINCALFKSKNPRGVVFFLHGRGKNLDHWAVRRVDFFLRENYDIFLMDYRGFGKSSKGFKEKWLKDDSLAAYNFVKERYKEEEIIVYGESLGTTLAIWVAANNSPKILVLDAPFLNMIEAASHAKPFIPKFVLKLILKYELRSDLWIQDVNAPVYIFHGDKDVTVPIEQGKKLFGILQDMNKSAEFICLRNQGHDKMYENETYRNRWTEIINKEV